MKLVISIFILKIVILIISLYLQEINKKRKLLLVILKNDFFLLLLSNKFYALMNHQRNLESSIKTWHISLFFI